MTSTDDIMNQKNSLKFGNNNEFMAFVARKVDTSNKQVFVDESLYPEAKPIAEVLSLIQGPFVAGSDDSEDMLQSLEAIKTAEILNNRKISVSVSNSNF